MLVMVMVMVMMMMVMVMVMHNKGDGDGDDVGDGDGDNYGNGDGDFDCRTFSKKGIILKYTIQKSLIGQHFLFDFKVHSTIPSKSLSGQHFLFDLHLSFSVLRFLLFSNILGFFFHPAVCLSCTLVLRVHTFHM